MRTYSGKHLDFIAYPLGGIGAGMFCIEGTGAFSHMSVRNAPDVHFEPNMFSAITILGRDRQSRVIEGPLPDHKVLTKDKDAGRGIRGRNYGFPRFSGVTFQAEFPFARLELTDSAMSLTVDVEAWSPFIPGREDDSSLPFAGVEYIFENRSEEAVDAVYYFCAPNFMALNERSRVRPITQGFVLEQDSTEENPHHQGAFAVSVDSDDARVNTTWFRGMHYDTSTMLWNTIEKGNAEHRTAYEDPENGESPGGHLAVPFHLKPGERRTIRLRLSWFVPKSALLYEDEVDPICEGGRCTFRTYPFDQKTYEPWYTTVLRSIDHADDLWSKRYNALREDTSAFSGTFHAMTLPKPLMEAVSANLPILKSPTLLRQSDGRMWGFEGCADKLGCCAGSCTHVYNYAQTLSHLFPNLERTFRETEFNEMQDERSGHQNFRAYLPIRPAKHEKHAASDGQLGGIIRTYREWRISGDLQWVRSLWDKVTHSLEYCIREWDPEEEGALKEPHHNTYDIEFWGPDSMSMTFYVGALKATSEMGRSLGENVERYEHLYEQARAYLETTLYNGEYFHQLVMSEGLNHDPFSYKTLAHGTTDADANAETRRLVEAEGPKYQYKNGCLSDAVLGVWLSEMSGIMDLVDHDKVDSTLRSIHRYNYKPDLSDHANPQRSGYAVNDEPGLLLCTWPHGGRPSLPFIYSDEVWTGIEHQVASHLLFRGYKEEALDIIRATRTRYDGTRRNPFDEYECGHWYVRAMASYGLLQGYTGLRYDAVDKTLHVSRRNAKRYTVFLSTATGYGTVHVSEDDVSLNVVRGSIDVEHIAVND